MQRGTDDYLIKPFDVDVVITSLNRALQRRRLEQEVENYRRHLEEMVAERTQQLEDALKRIERSYEDTLEVLGATIDLRDSLTAGHSRRVVLYSMELAMSGVERELRDLAMGAWLDDIGKLAIPDGMLRKPGALTVEERSIMQRHAMVGYRLVKDLFLLRLRRLSLRTLSVTTAVAIHKV
jgi:putative two-component system response regulator